MINAINYVSLNRKECQINISLLILGFTTTTPVSTVATSSHEECYVMNGTDTVVVQVS
jgi:hypothetical protein